MNEEEIEQLYEELSDLYGKPMPIYFIYDRRPEVITPRVLPRSWGEQVLLKITISRKVGAHFQLNRDVAEDPFGFIMLSRGIRGIRRDEAVHEFFHYYDHLINFFTGNKPVDEASVRHRTSRYIKNSRATSGYLKTSR